MVMTCMFLVGSDYKMLIKPTGTTDNFDLSWIQRDVLCWIYFPQEEQGPIYTKGIIKGIVPLSFNKGNSKVMCVTQNGLQHETKASNLQKRRHSNSIQKDLISLEIINPAQILFQLKKRLEDKKIHIYMWNSLIIVNPFVMISGMYDEKVMKYFYDKVIVHKKGLPQIEPHIYGFVCNILNNMKISEKCQMINISGQSGSGKTQTNKQCLKIISFICQSHIRTHQQIKSYLIEQRILNCDSVLECFGNAKTSKNDNSSRFGKLITQKINSKEMEILHCEVKVFFLEKSRIIHQIQGERNFHIFYQLITYCPDQLKGHLGFKTKSGVQLKLTDFNYLTKHHTNHIRDQDKTMWNNLNNSFRLLEINQVQKKQIYEVIAAVLHLGNLKFDESSLNDHDPCQIVNEEVVTVISELLMIDKKILHEGLVFNRRVIAGDVLYLPMTQRQCIEGRDSMAKALYQNLFLWLVQQLNKKVNQNQRQQKNVKLVKMLDIYGFQVFQHNSFEQLCVNYTNQRIHQIYLDQVFKHEKNILKKQGLESIIPQMKFTDNTKIIELLDTSLKSVFNLLDESCSLNVKDDDFLNNVKKMSEGHQNFPGTNNVTLKKCFIIKHTPGDIQYMAHGFREKNKDFLREDIVQKLSKSKSPILSQKFTLLYETLRTETNKKFLGFKIRKQITALMNEMSYNSDMHFIRCIKPNQNKQPLTFVDRVCYNQIRYLGVLDTVRMRKDCYHVRVPYMEFYKKFGILQGDVKEMIRFQDGFIDGDIREKVQMLMDGKYKNVGLDYLYGHERFFMKMETNNYLHAALKQKTKRFDHSSTVIKVIWRNRYKRTERKNFTIHIRKVQLALRSYLRDIILIKRKNAVKIIERQWLKRSQSYFQRKKLIPIKAIQKYIKKMIQKAHYQKQHKSIAYAKNMLTTMRKTHEAADKFDQFLAMKKQFNKNIYDMLWKKMVKSFSKKIQTYLTSFQTKVKNKMKVTAAQQKADNRILLRTRETLQKYFKTVSWAKTYQNLHENIVKVQKYCRMSILRKQYDKYHQMARVIQKNWRDYKIYKAYSMRKILKYFRGVGQKEKVWRSQLFRNLQNNKFNQKCEGVERILQKFERIKKDKIVLFYYLIDIQIFSEQPSLDNWVQNYIALTEQTLIKLNPIQSIDISNTHTVISTTSKVYTWGDIDTNPQIQQYQVNGKLSKIYAADSVTRIDSINPPEQQFIGKKVNQKQHASQNKQWNTLTLNFVLLNGIVLTMHKISFTKLNTPEKISQLACGMSHVICKTILKKVYTWGKNQSGQLGTGDYFDTNSMEPRLVQYFYKKRVPVNQVAASPQSSLVLDTNSKVYWFGTNGTITKVCIPQEFHLTSKSIFLGNHNKYSPVRIISRWSKTFSTIGLTLACHDDILKNQISLRKKVLQNLMIRWSQDLNLINPPYSQSVADHISERHMPLPTIVTGQSTTPKNLTNREIRDQIINDIQKIQQAQRELLRTRKPQPKTQTKRRY